MMLDRSTREFILSLSSDKNHQPYRAIDLKSNASLLDVSFPE